MDNTEWEKSLQDRSGAARLAEWSASAALAADGDAGGGQVVSHGFAAEPPHHLERITAAVITANDRSAESSPLLYSVQNFLPELIDMTPLKALELLEERYRADASPRNAGLLQAAMNGITLGAAPDEHSLKSVERAAALFGREDTTHIPPKTDDIWFKAYEHANFGGRSVFEDMTPGWGYWRQPNLGAVGLNDAISSIAWNSSANEVGGNIFLFEDARYFGRYRNYPVIPAHPGQINYVGNDFNDVATSALIVRRFANETRPISLSALVPQSAIADIVNATPKVRPAGNAVFSWDMWPAGGSGSDWHPSDVARTFIYINVPITVHTPWPWPDYYAQVRYWIYLYVDGNGHLQGYVAYWGYYVESGVISGRVADGLKAAIPGTVGQVNGLVSQALGLANAGGPYSYVYYLPGQFQLAGNVSDDVTIVAVRR